MTSPKKFHYLKCCVDFSRQDVEQLEKMIDNAVDITYETFLRHVSFKAVSEMFGYAKHPAKGLTLGNDFHVSYYRSEFNGTRCYFVKHSAIEYIFVPEVQHG